MSALPDLYFSLTLGAPIYSIYNRKIRFAGGNSKKESDGKKQRKWEE